jgi:hypothetical protein
MDVEAAFNGCRFQLEAGAPKSGLQLTACPAQPRGSAGRKLRMGRASWEGDDDGDEIECESLQLFPLTTPATGSVPFDECQPHFCALCSCNSLQTKQSVFIICWELRYMKRNLGM